jgi:hypothetical protein
VPLSNTHYGCAARADSVRRLPSARREAARRASEQLEPVRPTAAAAPLGVEPGATTSSSSAFPGEDVRAYVEAQEEPPPPCMDVKVVHGQSSHDLHFVDADASD